MGLRIRKSFSILPGTKIHINSHGVNMSTKLAKGVHWHTKLIGGKRRKSTRTATTQNPKPFRPYAFRWWWFLLALIFIMMPSYSEAGTLEVVLGILGLVMLGISGFVLVRRILAWIRAGKGSGDDGSV